MDGEEFTYDTVCVDGNIVFENMRGTARGRSSCACTSGSARVDLAARRRACRSCRTAQDGPQVLAALGFEPGSRTWSGTARRTARRLRRDRRAPTGSAVVDLMNVASDGECPSAGRTRSCTGGCSSSSRCTTPAHLQAGARLRPDQPGRRARTAARRVRRSTSRRGLLPVGAPRRDWRSTVTGDGMVVVRHPELQRVIEMTEQVRRPTSRCTPSDAHARTQIRDVLASVLPDGPGRPGGPRPDPVGLGGPVRDGRTCGPSAERGGPAAARRGSDRRRRSQPPTAAPRR